MADEIAFNVEVAVGDEHMRFYNLAAVDEEAARAYVDEREAELLAADPSMAEYEIRKVSAA